MSFWEKKEEESHWKLKKEEKKEGWFATFRQLCVIRYIDDTSERINTHSWIPSYE